MVAEWTPTTARQGGHRPMHRCNGHVLWGGSTIRTRPLAVSGKQGNGHGQPPRSITTGVYSSSAAAPSWRQ